MKIKRRLLIFSVVTVLLISCMSVAIIVPASAVDNETQSKDNLAFVYLETGEQKVVPIVDK